MFRSRAMSTEAKRPRNRQLHLWVCDSDYDFLVALAKERDQSVGATVRRMIRAVQATIARNATTPALRDDGRAKPSSQW
jgi:hypothetical protein